MKKHRSKRARLREFTPEIRQAVYERSRGTCEICHLRPIAHLHHTIFRRHVQVATLEIALGLCIPCHNAVHATRAMREYAVALARELAATSQADGSYNTSGGVEKWNSD